MPDQYNKLVGNTSKYPYLVGITTESGNFGSGILISAGFVLTCNHVLRDCNSAEVVFREGITGAEVQKIDESLDLALLKLTTPISAPKANFAEVPLRPNAVVLAVGVQETPGKSDELLVAEIELKLRNQNIADDKILDIQLDGGARPGYSGGPVVVEKGRALFCVGVLRSGGAGSNTSNAVGLAPIRAFVEEYVPDMLESTLGTNANGIRRLLILTTILIGIVVVGAIAKWPKLGSHPTKVTGSPVIVAPPKDTPIDSAKVPSRQDPEGSATPTYVVPLRTPGGPDKGNPDVKVWVNTPSNVYHCPGTRWYGTTKHGEYMTQADAQKKANRPAYGKVCP
jgi:Trypsin-like peptidase domain